MWVWVKVRVRFGFGMGDGDGEFGDGSGERRLPPGHGAELRYESWQCPKVASG